MIFKNLTVPAHVHDFFQDATARELVLRPFKGYGEFVKDYFVGQIAFDAYHYHYVQNIEVNGWRISIQGKLRLVWRFISRYRAGLLIGGDQVRFALNGAAGVDLKIALTHHPIHFLRRLKSQGLPKQDSQMIIPEFPSAEQPWRASTYV